jgi:hypothetical protein
LIEFGSSPYLFLWKNNTGTARAFDSNRVISFGLPGSPDIIGITNDGRFIGIECKTGKAVQSPQQKKFQAAIEKFNGIYILVRSVDETRESLKCHLRIF